MKQIIYTIAIIIFYNIASYGQIPNWIWAQSSGGESDESCRGMATDPIGNVYITGYYATDSITFDSITLHNVNGNYDIFIAKFNASGNVLWAKSIGETGMESGTSVSTDSDGNVYLAGYFYSSSITFGSFTLTNSGSSDIFLVKYDSTGNVLWARKAGNTDQDASFYVKTDYLNNVYITGNFHSSSINFGSYTLINAYSNEADMFIAKYDESGNVVWAKSAGGTSEDSGQGLVIDKSGNVFLLGVYSSSSITFGTTNLTNLGNYDIFLIKYNISGNVIWAKRAGGTYADYGNRIALDTIGNIYFTGNFSSSTIDFDSISLTNAGNEDLFLAKYDSTGNVMWAKSMGGINSDVGYDIAFDNSIYITGFFSSPTINFDSITLTRVGQSDIFLAKYDLSGNVIWALTSGGVSSDISYNIAIGTYDFIYISGNFNSSVLAFGSNTITSNDFNWKDIFIAAASMTTGLQESLTLISDFQIYPNPTSSNVTMTILPETKQIQIINSLGQIVQKTIVNRQTNFNFTLKDRGIYFIQVTTDKHTVTKKLIVTN